VTSSPFSAIPLPAFLKSKKVETERNLPRVALFADPNDLSFDVRAVNIPATIKNYPRGGSLPKSDEIDVVALCVSSQIGEALDSVGRMGHVPVIALVDRAEPALVDALFRAGVADVLPLPLSTDALSLALHRISARRGQSGTKAKRRGKVIGVLGASGGAGASSVLVNLASLFNAKAKAGASVAIVDLDIQTGVCATLLDLQSGGTVTDLFSSGGFGDVDVMREAFSRHASGIRLLSAPQDIAPLESLDPLEVEQMLQTASESFDLTLLDLPNAWTAWSDAALRLCDVLVLITTPDVIGVHQARRQLRMIAAQGLDDKPLIMVANKVRTGWTGGIDLKDCEKSIGRAFEIVVPLDEEVMRAATNQGIPVSAVRKGTKLEKALVELTEKIANSFKRVGL
jgi:pilus assembly protein CpaE